MGTMYLCTSSHFQPPNYPQMRHIPVKRIAPCPPSHHIIAEAKRSRVVHRPSTVWRRPPPLTVRNTHYFDENGRSARTVTWSSGNWWRKDEGHGRKTINNGEFLMFPFQPYCNVGSPAITTPMTPVAKGLHYDPINAGNVARILTPRASPGATDMTKSSKCCPPLLTSSSGYSTPPYNAGASTPSGKEVKKSRKRPLAHKFKRPSAASEKIKANTDVECFEAMKNVAHGRKRSINVSSPQRNVPHPELNALSVYHSFLKRREEAMRNEQASEMTPSTTNRVSRTSVSVKITDISVRYSSNFNPRQTSTPHKPKPSSNESLTKISTEFKAPFPPPSRKDGLTEFKVPFPPPSNNGDQKDATLAEILQTLEEERQLGNSHIMLPVTELTDMVRDLQKKQQTEGDAENSSCSGSTGTTASNNNNDDLNVKMFATKPALPSIYPIGAPLAASSPRSFPRKRMIADDRNFNGMAARDSKRHTTTNNESAFSMGLTGGAADVWRPW